jgi:putative heme-binding domain-containing protein
MRKTQTKQLRIRPHRDAQRGRKAFENGDYSCNSCHGLARGEAGVGPSLWDVGARLNRLELAIAIFDPNETIAPAYQKVTLVKNDGVVLKGQLIHRDESNRRTQLRDADGQLHLVADKDVEERATSPSEMPQDIVDLVPSSQAFADLIDFLAGLRPKSGVKTQTGVTQ